MGQVKQHQLDMMARLVTEVCPVVSIDVLMREPMHQRPWILTNLLRYCKAGVLHLCAKCLPSCARPSPQIGSRRTDKRTMDREYLRVTLIQRPAVR